MKSTAVGLLVLVIEALEAQRAEAFVRGDCDKLLSYFDADRPPPRIDH